MKNLDGLIYNLRNAVHFDDRTSLVVTEDLTDAIEYLEEYKRYQSTPSRNGHMALVDYFEESQKNEPLTWDELRRMEGKPVWVELQKCGNHWVIITDDLSNGLVCRDMFGINVPLYKDRIGKTWNAYRKERK